MLHMLQLPMLLTAQTGSSVILGVELNMFSGRHCPEGHLELGICGDASCFGCVSFIVGYFSVFPFCWSYLIDLGVGIVRHFLTL